MNESGTIAVSSWAPLKRPLFRNRLLASLVSNTGGWMQDTAGAWLMTSMPGASALLVALMQTAAALPVLLLGLPAGAMADVMDRRRLLLFWGWWMLLAAVLLAVLTMTGHISPWSLLLLTFVLSIGSAMTGPTWQAIVPELVPRAELPDGIALNSAAFNIARAIGPAAGGLAVAAFYDVYVGAGVVFIFNAISFLAVIYVLLVWKRKPLFTSTLPGERVMGSIRSGIRYTRFSPAMRTILIRAFMQTFCVSAMWALLPVVAQAALGKKHGALSYGVLNGCIGAGAVVGAVLLSKLRGRFSAEAILRIAAFVFAAVLITLGYITWWPVLAIMLALAGVAWTSTTSSLNIAVQFSVPPWVQARSLGAYQCVFWGGMAIGSVLWGVLADHTSLHVAYTVAALGLLASVIVGRWFPLSTGEHLDLSPGKLAGSLLRAGPNILIEAQPDDGPVRVTVAFRIDPEQADAFIRAAYELRTIRRRDGALRWALFRDAEEPGLYIESFIIESWVEHLRLIERFTAADNAIRDRVFGFQIGDRPPIVHRTIMARLPKERAREATREGDPEPPKQ